MSVPGIVEAELGEESVAAQVSLGGGDELFVTPTRTLVYRDEGLLSDESVDTFPHDADRVSVSEGRRKSSVALTYGGDERSFSVPGGRVDEVLRPMIAGVLRANDVTDEDERIAGAFRFSELTLVVTGERLIRHLGGAVWDGDFEAYGFEAVTDLAYEEGSVATQLVLTVDGRTQRIKVPNEEFPAVREVLEEALLGYHDVDRVADLPDPAGADGDGDGEDGDEAGADGEDGDGTGADGDDPLSLDSAVDPLATGDGGVLDDDGPGADGPRAAGNVTATGSGAERSGAEGSGAEGTATGSDGDETATGSGGDGTATGSAGDEGGTDADGPAGPGADEGAASAAADADAGAADPDPDPAGGDHEGSDDAGSAADDADDAPATPFTEELEPAGPDAGEQLREVREELADLRAAVEKQNDLLAKQHRAVKRLVDVVREDQEGD